MKSDVRCPYSSLLELLHYRKSSRNFSTKRLEPETIERIKKATQLSASCFNNQPWRFLFLYEEKALEKGRQALKEGNSWAEKAPLLVVGFSRADSDCQTRDGRDYYLFDLGLASQLIMLQATELNLSARPMAGFYPQKIKTLFNIDDEYTVMVMIAIGYDADETSDGDKPERKRNPLHENFFDNRFQD
ncbi:nitroreductase [candidate division KSB1 bacterium]|nr:nitroreductase [candidate division KSB1 bacterium]